MQTRYRSQKTDNRQNSKITDRQTFPRIICNVFIYGPFGSRTFFRKLQKYCEHRVTWKVITQNSIKNDRQPRTEFQNYRQIDISLYDSRLYRVHLGLRTSFLEIVKRKHKSTWKVNNFKFAIYLDSQNAIELKWSNTT